MTTAKLNAKGQITIPIKVRKELQLNAGDQLVLEREQETKYNYYAF